MAGNYQVLICHPARSPGNMAGTHKIIHHGSASLQVHDTQSEIRVFLTKLASWREESLRHLGEILGSCANSISKGIKDQGEEVEGLQTRLSVTTKWLQNYLQEAVDELNYDIRQISDNLCLSQPVMEPEENDSYDPLEMCEPELSHLDTNVQDGDDVSVSDNAQGIEPGNSKNLIPKRKRGRPPTGKIASGKYCTAEGCHNNQGTGRGLSFYRFPKDELRCKQWAIRVDRKEANGKLWMPKTGCE